MRALSEEEVIEYLETFGLREKLIVRLAIFEGLRPGEILECSAPAMFFEGTSASTSAF